MASPLGRDGKGLGPGDRGEGVRSLQQMLTAVGLHSGTPDGRFSEATRASVISFQRRAGLPADGVVGEATARALATTLRKRARSEVAAARGGLAQAARSRRLAPASLARHRAILDRTFRWLDRAPARAAGLLSVLESVAAHAGDYDEPRALVLFRMLEANARRLPIRPAAGGRGDVEDRDGIVYRPFPGRGFQFHPLANFARLNVHVTRNRRDEAARLAAALVARGVRVGDGLLWEYYFPFGGPARWTSGLAQAVAAQSLSRSGELLDDRRLVEAGRAAYRAIPARLAQRLGGGTWVREYSFGDMVILNAQLQTLLSVSDYADRADDAQARAFAGRLATATRSLLPRFDSGCWSLYSLGGAPASRHYHRYHVAMLGQLARKTRERIWSETARRWRTRCGERPRR
ncbi:MAG: peptidoglycan-binding protein [Actinomycetota bacterium]|nr:peptidoglycan-binding protein [Actinomycetota bacterium]